MSMYLMGVGELRLRLGLSRQRIYQLTRRPDWPAPFDVLIQGTVWRRDDVEAWIAANRPRR